MNSLRNALVVNGGRLKNLLGVSAVMASSVVASRAFAEAESLIDTDTTAQIAQTKVDILAVGAAIIGLAVVALGIRWVKATFF